MQAPLCKNCGKREWNHLCGAIGLSQPAKPKKSAPEVKPKEPQEYGSGFEVKIIFCACGCGQKIPIKPRYYNATCRKRALRQKLKDAGHEK